MKDKTDLAVFVYGTLKLGGSAWARLCAGRVAQQQPARARGRLFHLRKTGHPTLVVASGSDSWVKGWRLILRDAEVLREFDQWEEYDPEQPAEKNVYQRVRIECFADSAEKSSISESLGEAWVYVMMPERVKALDGVEIPDGQWTGAPDA